MEMCQHPERADMEKNRAIRECFDFFTHFLLTQPFSVLLSQPHSVNGILWMMDLSDWYVLIYGCWIQRSNYLLLPFLYSSLNVSLSKKIEMLVNRLEQLLSLVAVQAEQNLWFSIRMNWSWSTFWWVKIMRGWPGQSVRWRWWGEEGRSEGSRKGERDCGKGSGRE